MPVSRISGRGQGHSRIGGNESVTPLRWIDLAPGQERGIVRLTIAVAPGRHGALLIDPYPAWNRDWRRVLITDSSQLIPPA